MPPVTPTTSPDLMPASPRAGIAAWSTGAPLNLPHEEAAHQLEVLVRAYDPRISCATRFPDLRIVKHGAEEGIT